MALIDGPVDLPLVDKTREATVDLVTVDWQVVASRIVDDISSGDAFKEATIVFEAEAHRRVRLSLAGASSAETSAASVLL